jgi:hypothetical protein
MICIGSWALALAAQFNLFLYNRPILSVEAYPYMLFTMTPILSLLIRLREGEPKLLLRRQILSLLVIFSTNFMMQERVGTQA